VDESFLKVIIPTKYKQASNKTTQANQIHIPEIFQVDSSKLDATASTSKSGEKTIIKNVKHIKVNPKPSASRKKEKNLPKANPPTANMFLKKPKLDKDKEILKLHVSSDEGLTADSDDGEMQIEKGMEVLPHHKDRSK